MARKAKENETETETPRWNMVKVDADAQTVQRRHVTQTKLAGDVQCDWTFDFKDCSDREILELASRSVLISARGSFKPLERAKVKEQQTKTISVREFLDGSGRRGTKSNLERAAGIVGKLSDEERAQLLAQLQGETDEQEA